MKPFLIVLTLCLWSVGAHAQQPEEKCLEQKVLQDTLLEQYSEQVVFQGIATGGVVLVEIYAAAEGETFSIVYTAAMGGKVMSCLISSGDGWSRRKPETKLGDPS